MNERLCGKLISRHWQRKWEDCDLNYVLLNPQDVALRNREIPLCITADTGTHCNDGHVSDDYKEELLYFFPHSMFQMWFQTKEPDKEPIWQMW